MKTDQSKWLPIESAPRGLHHHVMLAYAPDDVHLGGFVSQGYWLEADDDGPDNMGHDGGFVDVHFDFFRCARSFGAEKYRSAGLQPTHWMSLPPPPGEDSPKQPVSVEVSSDDIKRLYTNLFGRTAPDYMVVFAQEVLLCAKQKAILALAGGERKEASEPDPVAVMTTQGLKFYSAEVAKSLHVGTQFYTEPVKEASKPVADELEGDAFADLLSWTRAIRGFHSAHGPCSASAVIDDLDSIIDKIEAISASPHPSNAQPSAEQPPKSLPTCHWWPDESGDMMRSECGKEIDARDGITANFCFHCGKHVMEHSNG